MRGDDNPMGQKLSISLAKGFALFNQPGAKRLDEGYLLAWDPVNQREVWRVSFGAAHGGGTLATAGGLVFEGNGQQEFAAYRADTGRRLWGTAVNTGIVAGPITYQIDGEQFIAVVSGARLQGNYYGPNYSRLLVFKLGGTAQLPPAVPAPEQVLNTTPEFGTPAMLERGEERYHRFCGTCHGTDSESRGLFPDLRYSAALSSREVFSSIVLEGALKENGMVSFRTALSPEDAEAVRAYMVGRARYAALHGPGGFAALRDLQRSAPKKPPAPRH